MEQEGKGARDPTFWGREVMFLRPYDGGGAGRRRSTGWRRSGSAGTKTSVLSLGVGNEPFGGIWCAVWSLVGGYTGKKRFWSRLRLEQAPKWSLLTRSAIGGSAPSQQLLGVGQKNVVCLGSSFYSPEAVGAAGWSPNKRTLSSSSMHVSTRLY